MAVGDAVGDIVSVAAGAYLDVQPAGAIEWNIHHCGGEDSAELYYYDGTDLIKLDADAAPWWMLMPPFHVTNVKYLRIKNTHATLAKLLWYNGVVSKV